MIDHQQRDAVDALQHVGLHNQLGRAAEHQLALAERQDAVALQHRVVQIVGHGHHRHAEFLLAAATSERISSW